MCHEEGVTSLIHSRIHMQLSGGQSHLTVNGQKGNFLKETFFPPIDIEEKSKKVKNKKLPLLAHSGLKAVAF